MLRRRLLDQARTTLVGGDQNRASSADRQAQRAQIAEFVRTLIDGKFDPMVVIEMLIGGLAFLGDNHGVSREQMADALREVAIAKDRTFIYTPTDG